jgi:hypothetical protein
MSLQVVNFANGQVTIESDLDGTKGKEFPLAINELSSAEARRLAEKHAAQHGLSTPGVGIPTSPYPVDKQGELMEGPTGQPHRYRIDVPVTSRI